MQPDSSDIAQRQKRIYRVTLTGGAVNLLLVVFKFLAGYFGKSSAMIADAVHSLSDMATDLVVLVFVKLAGRARDSSHDYGHGKFETLASLLIGVALLAVGIGLAADGVRLIYDFLNGQPVAKPNGWALSAAAISIVLKEGLYRYTIHAAKELDCQALAANAWHHRSDALTSIATLAGIGGAMIPGAGWGILDPLAAIIVSLFIAGMSWTLIKPALEELLEKSLPAEDKARIADIIKATPGILAFHNLRARRIGAYRGIDVHIKMPGDITLVEAHDIATTLENRLKSEFGSNSHVGIHMEPMRESPLTKKP